MWWTLLWLNLAQAERFDRVVAQVDQELVLNSEVALDKALGGHDPEALPFWIRSADPLERMVQSAVVRVAAGDVSLYQPTPDEIAARVESVRLTFPERQAWTEFLRVHGVDEQGLRTILRRRMVVERFLRRNLQPSIDNEAAWLDAADELLVGLMPRVRVRMIPPEGP